MSRINWNTTKAEDAIIQKIMERAVKLARKHNVEYEGSDVMMDITACHMNGTPLDLKKLLNADDANFAHDVWGIRRHINRENGKIENCFVPRMAARQEVAA